MRPWRSWIARVTPTHKAAGSNPVGRTSEVDKFRQEICPLHFLQNLYSMAAFIVSAQHNSPQNRLILRGISFAFFCFQLKLGALLMCLGGIGAGNVLLYRNSSVKGP